MRTNEDRADMARVIVDAFSDRNYVNDPADIGTDIADMIADLFHLAERYGIHPDDMARRAANLWVGDARDEPRVVYRTPPVPCNTARWSELVTLAGLVSDGCTDYSDLEDAAARVLGGEAVYKD